MSQTFLSVSKPNSFQWHFRSLFHLFGLSTSHSFTSHHYSGVRRKMSSNSFWTTWKNSKRVSRIGDAIFEFTGNVVKAWGIVSASYVLCISESNFASESYLSNHSLLLQPSLCGLSIPNQSSLIFAALRTFLENFYYIFLDLKSSSLLWKGSEIFCWVAWTKRCESSSPSYMINPRCRSC